MTRKNNVILSWFEKVVRLITESSKQGPSKMVQNPDRRDFARDTEKTHLMLASSGLDLNIEQEKNDETHNFGDFEDGDFPALRPNYDRRVHVHQRRLLTHTINYQSSF